MKKALFILFWTILIINQVLGQQNYKLKKIIDFKGTDSVRIQEFDNNKNLIFFRSFPDYGMSQIITYTYDNQNRMINYSWAHSNIGYNIFDYVYDTITNTKTTFLHEFNGKIVDLSSFKNEKDLKQSPQFKKCYMNNNKVLNAITYYKDTFPIKEIMFTAKGDTEEITTYLYEKKLLINEKLISKKPSYFNDLYYEYDNYGNQIQWMKVFGGNDTATIYKKQYIDNLLVEEKYFNNHKLETIKKYSYENKMLKYEIEYDSTNKLLDKVEYFYNSDNLLIKKIDSSQNSTYNRSFYFYE